MSPKSPRPSTKANPLDAQPGQTVQAPAQSPLEPVEGTEPRELDVPPGVEPEPAQAVDLDHERQQAAEFISQAETLGLPELVPVFLDGVYRRKWGEAAGVTDTERKAMAESLKPLDAWLATKVEHPWDKILPPLTVLGAGYIGRARVFAPVRLSGMGDGGQQPCGQGGVVQDTVGPDGAADRAAD